MSETKRSPEEKKNAGKLLKESDLLKLFFDIRADGKVIKIHDYHVYEYILEHNYICIVGGVPFIYKNGIYERDDNGSKLKGLITEALMIRKDVITSTIQNRIYNLFINDPELQYKMDQMNNYPKHYIAFKDTMYDPIEGKLIDHSPKFRTINKISMSVADIIEGKQKLVTNKKIKEWLTGMFPDADDLEMVLEYLGYCLTTDTRQQKFMILYGLPSAGKSVIIKAIGDIVGADNISSLPLEKLSHRFASYNLLGKLVNSCGDISTAVIEDITTQKQALGEDYIQAEAKGKDAISYKPYAKMLFSANGLPTIKNEESSGFYRRVLVANVNHNVEKVDPAFYDKVVKPDLDVLCYLIVDALGKMYRRGVIHESNGSKASVNEMWEKSDPVKAFLNNCITHKSGSRVERRYMYQIFDKYRFQLGSVDHISSTEFYSSLKAKGYNSKKSNGLYYYNDLEIVKGCLAPEQYEQPEIHVK